MTFASLFQSHRRLATHATRAALASLAVVLCILAATAGRVSADVVHLDDGTTVEGTVKKIGSAPTRSRPPTASTSFVPESKVAKIDAAGGGGALPGKNAPGGSAKSAAPSAPATGAGGFTADYYSLKSRTDRMDEPVRAVTLWERHLARKDLSAAEREQAERDLKYWKDLYKNDAEKVKGRWMQGEELKSLKNEADELVRTGLDLEENQHNILDAVRNYQKAIRLYPQELPGPLPPGLPGAQAELRPRRQRPRPRRPPLAADRPCGCSRRTRRC